MLSVWSEQKKNSNQVLLLFLMRGEFTIYQQMSEKDKTLSWVIKKNCSADTFHNRLFHDLWTVHNMKLATRWIHGCIPGTIAQVCSTIWRDVQTWLMVGLLDHVKHLLCVSSRTDVMTVNQLQYELQYFGMSLMSNCLFTILLGCQNSYNER